MFRIKICGITTPADGAQAEAAGADAIGLNFFPGSPRHVSHETAKAIVQALSPRITKVGVFVNASVEEIRQTSDRVGLDLIQLHGDETAEFARQLDLPLLRAIRFQGDLDAVRGRYLEHESSLPQLQGVLIDAFSPGVYGGSGVAVDWGVIPSLRRLIPRTPLVLAGGLRADNVAEAITLAQPDGVDTASGVEVAPGRKSPELMRRFVSAALAAWFRQSPASRL